MVLTKCQVLQFIGIMISQLNEYIGKALMITGSAPLLSDITYNPGSSDKCLWSKWRQNWGISSKNELNS